MSIDLDWAQLDEELCKRALDSINEALKTSKKPAFLGDIRATTFSFGKISPHLEIVEIRDVFDEFLHVENEDSEEDNEDGYYDDEDDFDNEDNIEGYGHHSDSQSLPGSDAHSYHRRPGIPPPPLMNGRSYSSQTLTSSAQHRHDPRRSVSPTASSMGGFSSGTGARSGGPFSRPLGTPGLLTPNAGLWLHHQSLVAAASSSSLAGSVAGSGGSASTTMASGLGNGNGGYPFPAILQRNNSLSAMSLNTKRGFDDVDNKTRQTASRSARPHPPRRHGTREYSPFTQDTIMTGDGGDDAQIGRELAASAAREAEQEGEPHSPGPSNPTAGLSLQLHFRIRYFGNMSISLSTTLKVNYPSPSFMSLPLSLRITGLAFEGLLVVAFEGDRKRLHVSVLDEEDKQRTKVVKGRNLLKHAFVESEVGQADKLVLKDVAKVEEFVLEMARKALQDEIAWPNFQSFAWT